MTSRYSGDIFQTDYPLFKSSDHSIFNKECSSIEELVGAFQRKIWMFHWMKVYSFDISQNMTFPMGQPLYKKLRNSKSTV